MSYTADNPYAIADTALPFEAMFALIQREHLLVDCRPSGVVVIAPSGKRWHHKDDLRALIEYLIQHPEELQ